VVRSSAASDVYKRQALAGVNKDSKRVKEIAEISNLRDPIYFRVSVLTEKLL
jgi:hypothetical protein